MTAKELIKFMQDITACFPNEKGQAEDAMKIKAVIWAKALGNISYKQAIDGLAAYCATNTSGFPPQPAHILANIRKERRMSDAEVNVILRRALCDSTYHAEEQFERLPDDLKRIIGTPAELRRQAMRENDDSKIFINQVCKEYRARVDGGTLDNTMLLSAEDKACIGQTMARLAAEVAK